MKLIEHTSTNLIGTVEVEATTHLLTHADGTRVTLAEIQQLDRAEISYDDAPSGSMLWVPICRIKTGVKSSNLVDCHRSDEGAECLSRDQKTGKADYVRRMPVDPFREWLAIDLQTNRLFVAVLAVKDDIESIKWFADARDPECIRQYHPITVWPIPAWNDLPLGILA